jgi:hypothetical protein
MGVGEDALADLARRGLLEWAAVGGAVWVRPAVVSLVAVRSKTD